MLLQVEKWCVAVEPYDSVQIVGEFNVYGKQALIARLNAPGLHPFSICRLVGKNIHILEARQIHFGSRRQKFKGTGS